MNSRPKKVYYVWNYIEWGGAQIYFLGLIRELKKHSEVCVILPRESDSQLLKFIENAGAPYKFIDTRADGGPAETLKRKLQRHRNKFKSEKLMVDFVLAQELEDSIVHIELGPWQSLWQLIRVCSKTEVFITTHNSLPPVPKWRFLLWKAKFALISKFSTFHFFASNEDAKESFKPLVPKKLFEEIRVTYTNVNPLEIQEALDSGIDRTLLFEKYKIPKNKFLVFCVGQFIDRKGRWIFLEAARNVLEKDDDFAFVWISNSKPTSTDLAKAAEFGLGENFIFITSDQIGKEHIDLFKVLRLADVFALVSLQEGLPIALLEAMALGIPSVSTRVNAIPEAIRHLETGWLIEPGDSEQLTSAFEKLKGDRVLREKLGRNGRELVLKKFDERNVARVALKSYREAFFEKKINGVKTSRKR